MLEYVYSPFEGLCFGAFARYNAIRSERSGELLDVINVTGTEYSFTYPSDFGFRRRALTVGGTFSLAFNLGDLL